MDHKNDYKQRMSDEYHQLKKRLDSLRTLLDKYASGTLEFTPSCSHELLISQYFAMLQYATILEQRALIEGVTL